MIYKVLGASMIIISCAFLGFGSAAGYSREVGILQTLRSAIRYMKNELTCRAVPLPSLCRSAAQASNGVVREFMQNLASELEAQICTNPLQCTLCALSRTKGTPLSMQDAIRMLGKTIGVFDLQGQLDGFDEICIYLDELILKRSTQMDARIRSYRTVGVCAGIALAIILI